MESVELLAYFHELYKRKNTRMCNDYRGDCYSETYCDNKCNHKNYKCDNCNLIQFCGCCYGFDDQPQLLICPKCNKKCEFKNVGVGVMIVRIKYY